jgi:hypothetical protein
MRRWRWQARVRRWMGRAVDVREGDHNDTVRYRVGRTDAPHRIGSIGAADGSAVRADAAATKVA